MDNGIKELRETIDLPDRGSPAYQGIPFAVVRGVGYNGQLHPSDFVYFPEGTDAGCEAAVSRMSRISASYFRTC